MRPLTLVQEIFISWLNHQCAVGVHCDDLLVLNFLRVGADVVEFRGEMGLVYCFVEDVTPLADWLRFRVEGVSRWFCLDFSFPLLLRKRRYASQKGKKYELEHGIKLTNQLPLPIPR